MRGVRLMVTNYSVFYGNYRALNLVYRYYSDLFIGASVNVQRSALGCITGQAPASGIVLHSFTTCSVPAFRNFCCTYSTCVRDASKHSAVWYSAVVCCTLCSAEVCCTVCSAVVCCTLCRAVVCCTLCSAVVCCTVLWCAVHCAVLWCAVHCAVLWCAVQCAVLWCAVLRCALQCCRVLYSAVHY